MKSTGAFEGIVELFSATASVSFGNGRIADDDGIGGNVFGDDTSRTDKGIFTDRYPAENRRIGANGSPFFDEGFF